MTSELSLILVERTKGMMAVIPSRVQGGIVLGGRRRGCIVLIVVNNEQGLGRFLVSLVYHNRLVYRFRETGDD